MLKTHKVQWLYQLSRYITIIIIGYDKYHFTIVSLLWHPQSIFQGGTLLSNACTIVALSIEIERRSATGSSWDLKRIKACLIPGGSGRAEPRFLDTCDIFTNPIACHARVSHSYDIRNPFSKAAHFWVTLALSLHWALKSKGEVQQAAPEILKE